MTVQSDDQASRLKSALRLLLLRFLELSFPGLSCLSPPEPFTQPFPACGN